MTHPIYVVEQAVHNFVAQWFNGLIPALYLSTKADSSITVLSEMINSFKTSTQVAMVVNAPQCRKRSGLSSRLRRKKNWEIVGNNTSTANSDDFSEATISDCQPSSIAPQLVAVSVSGCSTQDKPILSTKKLSSMDIAPEKSRSKKLPDLSVVRQSSLSIPPRTIHHPAIINACFAILGKHPSELTPTENDQFQQYKVFKASSGDPIEESVVYLPIGGLRTCLQCNNLT